MNRRVDELRPDAMSPAGRESYYSRGAIRGKFKLPRSKFVFDGKLTPMAKPHRVLKKPNHGSRPANSKARKLKRKQIKT